LPYLEIEQGNPEEVEMRDEVTVPNIVGKTILEAQEILSNYNLELYLEDSESLNLETQIITNQVPNEGITVYKKSYVYISY
jgi:beta-lactam-binding protein with PASTA domain